MASITCNTCGALNASQAPYCHSCGQTLQVANVVAGTASNTTTGRLLPDYLLKQRYRIHQTIGRGGMGAVYMAQDTQLGNRVVAIKEMSQSNLSSQKIAAATDNFKKEAHMLAGLHHAQLPSIYDYFFESGRWYLVMSYIQGETLQEYMARIPGRKLPVAEVLSIGIQLCIVLDYLHGQHPPIIFRDLKPTNIMLSSDGHLYLIDFGIARLFKPGQVTDTVAYGSVGYCAPEQYGQAQTTPRSDIYSLGAVLHQLLSGYSPVLSPFHFASLQSSGQNVPIELEQLILQMLEMDENKRPTDVATVKQALQRIANALASSTSSTPSTSSASAAAPFAATALVKNVPPIPQMQQAPQASQQSQVLPDSPTQQDILPPTVAVQPAPRQSRPASTRKTSTWTIGWPQLIAMLIGTIICGLLLFLSESGSFSPWFLFPPLGNASIVLDNRLLLIAATLAITFFLAALYGPLVGLVVGGLSSLAAELLSATGLSFLYLDIGLAVAGFVVGLTLLRAARRYSATRNVVFVDAISALALLIYSISDALGLWLTGQMAITDALVTALIYGAMYLIIILIVLTLLLNIYNLVRLKGKPVLQGR